MRSEQDIVDQYSLAYTPPDVPSSNVAAIYAQQSLDASDKEKAEEQVLCLEKNTWFSILKGINVSYALWASVVFALMSFFRAEGENDFDRFVEKGPDTALGFWYAFTSLAVNIPMGYVFSYELIAILDKVIHPFDLKKDGDPYLTLSFILGFILGGGTTFAGIKLSNLSLEKWAPDGFADPTTAIFAWNTFTTRTVSATKMLHAIIRGGRIIAAPAKEGHEHFFTLLKDLERFGRSVGSISTPTHMNENERRKQIKVDNIFRVQSFYTALTDQGLQPTYTLAESGGIVVDYAARGSLTILAFVSLTLWLSLSESGLNQVASWFTDGASWGTDNAWLVWACSMSHLALYMRSAWNAPDIALDLFQRPALKKHFKDDDLAIAKRIAVVAGMVAFFGGIAWFSGAGYANTGAGLIENGFGSVADDVFQSDNGVLQIYQTLFKWFESGWSNSGLAAWYFYFMSGTIVNGSSALSGYLKHAPKCMQLPCLFAANEPGTVSCSEWLEQLKTFLSRHDGELTFDADFLAKIEARRSVWVRTCQPQSAQYASLTDEEDTGDASTTVYGGNSNAGSAPPPALHITSTDPDAADDADNASEIAATPTA